MTNPEYLVWLRRGINQPLPNGFLEWPKTIVHWKRQSSLEWAIIDYVNSDYYQKTQDRRRKED